MYTPSYIDNQDFSLINLAILIFPSGITAGDMRCVTVSILDDTRVENDEYFTLTLQSGSRTVVTGSSTMINIQDNDRELL